jgi:hypothetical protein
MEVMMPRAEICRILEPLRLRDSFFGSDRARLADRALQYEAAGKVLPYYTTATASDSSQSSGSSLTIEAP